MNTARLSAAIHFFGSYWVVKIGDKLHTCTNKTQLLNTLSGNPPEPKIEPPEPTTETVEEFLKRGGSINRIKPPVYVPLPKPQPENFIPTASRISFEHLFGGPKK